MCNVPACKSVEFAHNDTFNKHCMEYHQIREFKIIDDKWQCGKCNIEPFEREREFRSHYDFMHVKEGAIKRHKSKGAVACTECECTFHNVHDRNNHYKARHTNEALYKCEPCDQDVQLQPRSEKAFGFTQT